MCPNFFLLFSETVPLGEGPPRLDEEDVDKSLLCGYVGQKSTLALSPTVFPLMSQRDYARGMRKSVEQSHGLGTNISCVR